MSQLNEKNLNFLYDPVMAIGNVPKENFNSLDRIYSWVNKENPNQDAQSVMKSLDTFNKKNNKNVSFFEWAECYIKMVKKSDKHQTILDKHDIKYFVIICKNMNPSDLHLIMVHNDSFDIKHTKHSLYKPSLYPVPKEQVIMMDDSSMFPSMTSSVKRLNPSVNSAFISKTTTDDVRVSDDESDDESNDESDDESDDELDELDVENERNNPGTNNPQTPQTPSAFSGISGLTDGDADTQASNKSVMQERMAEAETYGNQLKNIVAFTCRNESNMDLLKAAVKESNIEAGMLRYLIDLIDPQEFQQYLPQYPQQQYFGQCYQKSCNTCNTELKLDGDTIYCPSCTN